MSETELATSREVRSAGLVMRARESAAMIVVEYRRDGETDWVFHNWFSYSGEPMCLTVRHPDDPSLRVELDWGWPEVARAS